MTEDRMPPELVAMINRSNLINRLNKTRCIARNQAEAEELEKIYQASLKKNKEQ